MLGRKKMKRFWGFFSNCSISSADSTEVRQARDWTSGGKRFKNREKPLEMTKNERFGGGSCLRGCGERAIAFSGHTASNTQGSGREQRLFGVAKGLACQLQHSKLMTLIESLPSGRKQVAHVSFCL